jgi:6-phosphogluconolactonase (cycloisomerase 2 family)
LGVFNIRKVVIFFQLLFVFSCNYTPQQALSVKVDHSTIYVSQKSEMPNKAAKISTFIYDVDLDTIKLFSESTLAAGYFFPKDFKVLSNEKFAYVLHDKTIDTYSINSDTKVLTKLADKKLTIDNFIDSSKMYVASSEKYIYIIDSYHIYPLKLDESTGEVNSLIWDGLSANGQNRVNAIRPTSMAMSSEETAFFIAGNNYGYGFLIRYLVQANPAGSLSDSTYCSKTLGLINGLHYTDMDNIAAPTTKATLVAVHNNLPYIYVVFMDDSKPSIVKYSTDYSKWGLNCASPHVRLAVSQVIFDATARSDSLYTFVPNFTHIIIDRTGKYAYIYDSNNSRIYMFNINQITGDFSPMSTPYLDIGNLIGGYSDIIIDSSNEFMYHVIGSNTYFLNIIKIDKETGLLSLGPQIQLDQNPISVASITSYKATKE